MKLFILCFLVAFACVAFAAPAPNDEKIDKVAETMKKYTSFIKNLSVFKNDALVEMMTKGMDKLIDAGQKMVKSG